MAFSLDYAIVEDDIIKAMVSVGDTSYGNMINMLLKLLYAIDFDGIETVTLAIVSGIVYRHALCRADNNKVDKWGIYEIDEMVIGLLTSLTYIFGKGFHEFGTSQILITGWTQVVKTGIVFCGSFLFFVNMVCEIKIFAKTNPSMILTAEDKTDTENGEKYRLKLFLLFVTTWSIYLVAYYPGMFMGDTEDTIYGI